MGSEPCLSEPKLGNVATALQGDSLTLRANLTVPICTWNGVLIQSVMLLWKMLYEKNERPCLSYIVFSKSIVKCFPKQNDLPGLWQVFSYWMQANKAQLKAKMTWLEVYLLRSAKFDVLFIKGVFTPSLVRTKKKDYRKTGKLNATQKWKKNSWSSSYGV